MFGIEDSGDKKTYRNHLTDEQATVLTVAITYNVKIEDVFSFVESKECKVTGIRKIKNLDLRQFTIIVSKLKKMGFVKEVR